MKPYYEQDGTGKSRAASRMFEYKWAHRADTTMRSGEACPNCGHRLGVVATRHRHGFKFTYIGCRKERGGCGLPVGSLKEQEA